MKEVMRFTGEVFKGKGWFSKQLILPTLSQLSKPIRDWPQTPVPGTLNVCVRGGLPAVFLPRFGNLNVRSLDSGLFVPEAELPWTDIAGNTLQPTTQQPKRGNAQVWRASLRSRMLGKECQAWVLRRIGSALEQDIELVSGECLREKLHLVDGSAVEVYVEGEWKEEAAGH